jgi:endoglucanase
VTYATDVPGTDPEEAGDHRLGGGPAIFRGPAVSPLLFDLLVATADEEGIAHTIEVGAKTYTDADHTHLSRGGVATAVVSVPLRNMHSPIEVVDLEDVEACVRLVAAFARRLEPGLDLRR